MPISGRPVVRIAGAPVYAMLLPFPVVCFIGAFFTDWAYAGTAAMQWANMSAWLLAIGLIVSVFAVVAGIVDLAANPSLRASGWVRFHTAGIAVAIGLSILNALIHSRDAYTSVVPEGLTLSAIVAVILVVSGWAGWRLVYPRDVSAMEDAA